MHINIISELTQTLWQQHTQQVTCHIAKSSIVGLQHTFEGAAFHCEDEQASSLRIYCPCLCFQAIQATFMDTSVFETVNQDPQMIVSSLVSSLQRDYGKSYPWAIGKGCQLPAGYILAKKKKAFQSGRPIISICGLTFSNLSQLHVLTISHQEMSIQFYTLLTVLQAAPIDGGLILINQDLAASFFTTIDQARFIGEWYMLLDFLREPHMNVGDNEVFSVYPGKSNNPGGLIKGRAFRRVYDAHCTSTHPSSTRFSLHASVSAHTCIYIYICVCKYQYIYCQGAGGKFCGQGPMKTPHRSCANVPGGAHGRCCAPLRCHNGIVSLLVFTPKACRDYTSVVEF
jgi:hypothetical protein